MALRWTLSIAAALSFSAVTLLGGIWIGSQTIREQTIREPTFVVLDMPDGPARVTISDKWHDEPESSMGWERLSTISLQPAPGSHMHIVVRPGGCSEGI